jgi:molybdenum cofactor cytidylyltransferase
MRARRGKIEQVPRGFAAVILAAGKASSRGRPLPLRLYRGRTLVEHAVRTALDSGASEVVVVVGEHAAEIRRAVRHLPVRVIENREWREGMASSIRTGISGLSSNCDAAILCLCDRVKVTADHLRALGERALAPDGPPIVASLYEGVLGAPAAFARSQIPRLLELTGEQGARRLIRDGATQVEAIEFVGANERVAPVEHLMPVRRELPERAWTKPCVRAHPLRAPPYGTCPT